MGLFDQGGGNNKGSGGIFGAISKDLKKKKEAENNMINAMSQATNAATGGTSGGTSGGSAPAVKSTTDRKLFVPAASPKKTEEKIEAKTDNPLVSKEPDEDFDDIKNRRK